MKKTSPVWYAAIIAVCFLYTGSAYMSQCFRLMDFYDEKTVDLISSFLNYLCQALGMLIFSAGLLKKPEIFRKKKLFAAFLVSGTAFMALSQLSMSGIVIVVSGFIFNIHIGIYFGFYLSLLSRYIPAEHAGLSFGTAYAFGSVGTYCFSLINNGNFLVKPEITVIYILLAATTVAIVLSTEDIFPGNSSSVTDTWGSRKNLHLGRIAIILSIMMAISVVGSGLFYSLPTSADVNWNLIRAFYAAGLIIAGFIMDKNRFVGKVCTIASLSFSLIAMALIGEGMTNTIVLGLSYAFRGFITIYYVIIFTDFGNEDVKNTYLAPAGLMISRVVEAFLSLILMMIPIPGMWQMLFTAICFIPLIILFILTENEKKEEIVTIAISEDKKLALFCEKYNLTSRETEILKCLKEGLSDSEIADRLFISKNTVRFHVSNLLKKTESDSRVTAVRALDMFDAT